MGAIRTASKRWGLNDFVWRYELADANSWLNHLLSIATLPPRLDWSQKKQRFVIPPLES